MWCVMLMRWPRHLCCPPPLLTARVPCCCAQTMFLARPEDNYLDAALCTAMQVHAEEPPGDILLFLTGQVQYRCTRACRC